MDSPDIICYAQNSKILKVQILFESLYLV